MPNEIINFKKEFFEGVNADDNPRFLGQGEALNIENFRAGVSEFTTEFQLSNIPSTEILYYYLPLNSKPIGRTFNYPRRRLIWFNYVDGSDQDAIYAYDCNEQTTYVVLWSWQIDEGLGFDLSYRISRNVRIVGDLLFWTDNNEQPRCINMERGIKLNQPSYVTDVDPYVSPIPYTSTTIIVRPPIYRLFVQKTTDVGFQTNFIAQNAYQFYYRYWYKDYQFSVLSTFSQLLPYNAEDETYNAIYVRLPFGEDIPDEVQQVDLCFRYGNFGKSFIIKSWNKDNFYDLLAIESHNNNDVQLGITFYDNTVGIAIDDVTANTPYDNVALKAKTIEFDSRIFLANVLKGYDSPLITSLQLTIGSYNTDGAGSYTANWKYFILTFRVNGSGALGYVTYYYAYQSTLNPTSYYYDTYGSNPSPPTALNSVDATTAWATETQLAAYIQRNNAPPVGTTWVWTSSYTFFDTGNTLNLIFAVDLGGLQFFKSSSINSASIAFYDQYRRKCGVVNDAIQINIDDRTSDQTVFATSLDWTLSNADPTIEIPDWAYYYQIVIAKNLTTRFFEQIFIIDTNYVVREQDGTYTYGTGYTETTYAIGLDVTPLFRYGLGYVFTEGDYVRIYFTDDTNIEVPVLAQDGNFVLVQPSDIGSLGAAVSFLVELFTPYKQSVTEPFFETGDMLDVVNPTTDSRQYSATNGSINGDCYAIERDKGVAGTELYFVEAMSPNDKVWQIWQTDRGWVNFFDSIGQQRKEDAIDWSETFIDGTKTNGLNKFDPLNTKDIGGSSGQIQKLQLANKVVDESGSILLIICQDATVSAYLSEVQTFNASSQGALITTDDVIGSINAMKFTAGTINPESIVEYNGVVWWLDLIRGNVVQYDPNGISPISYYKMRSFFTRFSQRYLELGAAAVEELCGFSYIESCVDPTTSELLFTLPQTEENVISSGIPVGFAQPLPSYVTLPDYASSIQNRFEFYDGQPKTVIYNFLKNKWYGAYQWLPDLMEYGGNKFFGFKNGWLHLFNESTTSFNTIFGVEYPERVCFVVNMQPNVPMDIFDLAVEGNMKIPNFTVCYCTEPNEQITDLTADDFTNTEGILYAKFFRDRLTPSVSGTVIDKMYKGDVLKSITAKVMLEWNVYDSQLINNFVNIGASVSGGHVQIMIKPKSNQ